MVSKYYNVNLRMPNYFATGVLRKTGNKIAIFLAPDYILGEYKDSKFFLSLYNTQLLIKDDNPEYEIMDVIVDFEMEELASEGNIVEFQFYEFLIGQYRCSLEIKFEITDFYEIIELEENYLKNIPE